MRKALLAAALAFPPACLAQGLEPGQWEFTSTMTLQGMPKPQTQTMQRCVTKEEAKDPQKWMGKRAEQAECKVQMKDQSATGARWEIHCPKQNMTGTGSARIGKGAMESEQVMRGTVQGRAFEMHMKMSGRRLGACRK